MIRVVANPAAGGYSAALTAEVRRRCRESEVDLTVVVGGDGTASRAARSPAPLHIVPAGTANSFYRTVWGDTPWQVALDVALSGAPPRLVDVARIAGTDGVVLSGASAGLPAQAIRLAKSAGTSYAAALADLGEQYEPYPGRVVVDGEVVHSGPTMLANVGGARHRGGRYELLPHSVLDDGLLDVCVVGASHSVRDMVRLTQTGAHVGLPDVVYARGRRVRLERLDAGPLRFEHDGEPVPAGRAVTLEVLPRALPVIAPG
ncbi:MAG TPA: diacylglycerol kinase family protein [Actinophytocola sp.]|jgi:diacylglycerol kinase (ATP)|uniref:diacylglycerol/lipid kinase family protein n=1 Tax=Actinophytocola sp. TaxID=1872138 RepID=UPI002F9420F0